jgi:hypothetical protein
MPAASAAMLERMRRPERIFELAVVMTFLLEHMKFGFPLQIAV